MLSKKDFDRIRLPIDQASTLPKTAFTDEQFFNYECKNLLASTWTAVDFGARIPSAGDLFKMTLYGHPILFVRNQDGVANAFHNVSPYDGAEISMLTKQSGLIDIETPYHSWHYDLDGQLLSAPFYDGTQTCDVLPQGMNLVSLPCHEWLGTLFVSLNEKVESFENYLAPVQKYLGDTDLSELNHGLDLEGEPMIATLPIKANWKTVYENYSPNVYHESSVHAMYRRSPHSPRVDNDGNKTYTEIIDPAGFIGLSYDNTVGLSLYPNSPLPPILLKTGQPSERNTICNMYPNWAFTVLNQYARIALFIPETVDHCTQMISTLYRGDSATSVELYDARKVAAKGGVGARVEDNNICESVQRARGSSAFDSFPYCPFWDKPHYALTNFIADKLEQSMDCGSSK